MAQCGVPAMDDWPRVVRQVYLWYNQSGKLAGLQNGCAIGEERGEKRERLNNAKGMLHEGLSADLISRVTGLSIAEINKLN